MSHFLHGLFGLLVYVTVFFSTPLSCEDYYYFMSIHLRLNAFNNNCPLVSDLGRFGINQNLIVSYVDENSVDA